MTTDRNFPRALQDIDALNAVCQAFRDAYRRAHPNAPSNRTERHYAEAVAYVRQHAGVDLSPESDPPHTATIPT